MDSIVLRGRTFIKASKIAKELGYTSDYIGQLCRGGKIEAELVGRTWFVDEASIRDHKETRYRSSAKATKKTLQRLVIDSPKQEKSVGYKSLSVRYESDEADLLPRPAKERLVDKTDTEGINIVSHDKVEAVRIKDLTAEPKTGKLKIVTATEEPEVVSQENTIPTQSVKLATTEVKVEAPMPVAELQPEKMALDDGEVMPISSVVQHKKANKKRVVVTSVVLSTIVSTGLAFLILTLTSNFVYESGNFDTFYRINPDAFLSNNILKNIDISF